MEKFRELGLSEEVLKILKGMQIRKPSEIQEKSIPLALGGKDIIGISKTGSGKTLAFSSAIIENIKPNKKIKALILTPTRELAEQVSDSIREFSKGNLKVVSVYGGVNIQIQRKKMKNADVLVGTPGRVLDNLNRNYLSLRNVEMLILDEFDRMFDMGFIKDVGKIIDECPKKRQTMLFSATKTKDVDFLSKKYTKKPIEISVDSVVDYSKLEQTFYDVPNNLKFSLLVHLLEKEKSELVMIFCSTRRNADFVAENLNNLGVKAKVIHGGLDQKKRIRTIKEFNEKKGLNVLVCTDVAARGLDIKDVTHVYNYDMPSVSSDYIHRVGRTARAGTNGKAINILSSRDYNYFREILDKENVQVKEKELPYLQRIKLKNNQPSMKKEYHKKRETRKRNDSKNNKERKLYNAVCMKCGKPCKVPFKPTTGKGVSCSNCFVKKPQKNNNRKNSNFSKNNNRKRRR